MNLIKLSDDLYIEESDFSRIEVKSAYGGAHEIVAWTKGTNSPLYLGKYDTKEEAQDELVGLVCNLSVHEGSTNQNKTDGRWHLTWVDQNKKIMAIKDLRGLTNLGLKESKDVIDAFTNRPVPLLWDDKAYEFDTEINTGSISLERR